MPLETLETNWSARHTSLTPPLRELLRHRLDSYRLSPTDLTVVLRPERRWSAEASAHGGLLRFPSAPSLSAIFGNVMHETLEWLQRELNQHGQLPSVKQTQGYFAKRLEAQALTAEQLSVERARGEDALKAYPGKFGRSFRADVGLSAASRDEGVVL